MWQWWQIAKRQVAGHKDAATLIAVGEDPEQQLDPAPADRHVAQFVSDQQVHPLELAQEPIQRVLLLLLLQLAHQFGSREEADPEPRATRGKSQSNRNMCLACSVAADKTTIEFLFNPLATGQLQDL